MSSSTRTSVARRQVSVRGRLLKISSHIPDEKRWEMNGDGTPIGVALSCATPLPFTKGTGYRAYDADEVWYYAPTDCVFIIKGDKVVTVTPANHSSLDTSSLIECDACEEWTSPRENGTEGYQCTYCDSELTTLTLSRELAHE